MKVFRTLHLVFNIAFLLCFVSAKSQVIHVDKCGLKKISQINGFGYNADILQKKDLEESDSQEYTIPVVFHILYVTKGKGPDALSDAFYIRQVQLLNEQFGKYSSGNNGSPLSEDAKIKFCLGNTQAIVRKQTPYSNLRTNDEMKTKSVSFWNPKRYLNIWVVNTIDTLSNIAGYSYLPTQSVLGVEPKEFDGIVIDYRFISDNNPFASIGNNKGKTLTHEIGHYLNLLHPWGGDRFSQGEGTCEDDDKVDDTPPCYQIYQSQFPICLKPLQCGTNRQIENYMDYSDERCANMFTSGQIKRMRSAIRKYRPQLVSCENLIKTECTTGCSPSKEISKPNFIELYPNPSNGFFTMTAFLDDPQKVTIRFYDVLGKMVKMVEIQKFTSGRYTFEAHDLPSGIYNVMMQINDREQYQKVIIAKD